MWPVSFFINFKMEEICPSVNGFPLFLACASSWQIGEKKLAVIVYLPL
jgi:hypothetical protein